jgi:uncharacterized lipoprotein YmbA
MKSNHSHWLGSLALLIAACTSTPVHYHTLVPASADAGVAQPAASYTVEVEPVKLPAQVDRFELVVRRSGGEIALLEDELWIAPLADELRNALIVEITRRLASVDTADAHRDPTIAVSVEVERFESAPAHYVLIEALWHLHVNNGTQPEGLACRTRAYQRVSDGYTALVHGHQAAVVSIADQIAYAARGLIVDGAAVCPTAPGS